MNTERNRKRDRECIVSNKEQLFWIQAFFPHTDDCSNTDTVTHSNHNSESADSQTNKHSVSKQTQLFAEDAWGSFCPPGSLSVCPPVCLPVRLFNCHVCHMSVPRLYCHRNYACLEEGGEIWWLICYLQLNRTVVILLTSVMFSFFPTVFFDEPYITCCHFLSFVSS